MLLKILIEVLIVSAIVVHEQDLGEILNPSVDVGTTIDGAFMSVFASTGEIQVFPPFDNNLGEFESALVEVSYQSVFTADVSGNGPWTSFLSRGFFLGINPELGQIPQLVDTRTGTVVSSLIDDYRDGLISDTDRWGIFSLGLSESLILRGEKPVAFNVRAIRAIPATMTYTYTPVPEPSVKKLVGYTLLTGVLWVVAMWFLRVRR